MLIKILSTAIFFLFSLSGFVRDDLTVIEKEKVNKVTSLTTNFSKAERSEALSGGAGTVNKIGKNAFSHHFKNLSFEQRQDFLIGNAFFRKVWIASPSSTTSSDGLGPLYNARACQSCHIKDGRGHLPKDEKPLSAVLKVGNYKNKSLFPNKIYGKQIQFFAIPGLFSESNLNINFLESNFRKNFLRESFLKYPSYELSNLKYGELKKNTSLSMRVSPQVIGVGLLEAIEESDILAKQDINDEDNDGVSGVARIVNDEKGNKKIGRFGIRASTPNLFTQTGVAFMHDMGLSNSVGTDAYGDCTKKQSECYKFSTGINKKDLYEVNDEVMTKIVFYLSSLSPPKRRNVSEKDVLLGKKIFYESKCTSCHTPKYVTSKNAKHDFLKYQLIWPYTDLLLHDMGDELADKDINGNITNKEWKTPPLWGLGYAKEVNSRATFLHDGRAKTILEAVMWHSGEAKDSLDLLLANYKDDLDKLEKFLKSL